MAYAKQTILDHAALVKAKEPADIGQGDHGQDRKGCLEGKRAVADLAEFRGESPMSDSDIPPWPYRARNERPEFCRFF